MFSACCSAQPSLATSRHWATRTLVGSLALVAGHVAPSVHAAPTQYHQGEPSDAEQFLLLQLNRARRDPVGEGQRLAAWLTGTATGKSVTAQYGIDPAQVAAAFAALPAVPPLAFNADLLAAALAHSSDLAAHGGNGPGGAAHAGYDGSTPDSRVAASGYQAVGGQDGYAGENVAPLFSNLAEVHAGYLVDWGVADLSHRVLSMDGTNGTNVVGIGVATVSGQATLDETEDFGKPGVAQAGNRVVIAPVPALLTGVVYTDQNNNGQYDPGEGTAAVTVSMDGGAYYALTTASGGFSLPLTHADGSLATGTVVVRMHGLPGESQDRTAVVQVARFASESGAYLANVEWEAVVGQPSAGVAAGPALAAFFAGAADLGGGWYYLAFGDGQPFGYFSVAAYPYVFHDDLGWEYVQDAQDGHGGVYLYDFASGDWWYTSAGFGFPYLYDFARHATLYCYPANGAAGHYSHAPRYFYDFAAQRVITL